MSPKKIVWVLIVLASLLIGGCRITLTPIVSLSSLRDSNIRTAPVVITANTDKCGQDFLHNMAELFKTNYIIKSLTCRVQNNSYDAIWETEIPLFRTGDEKKIPHVPASIYYSRNHSVILTLRTEFLNDIIAKARDLGMELTDNDVFITFVFKNDTKEDVNIAVENVFVNNSPVGRDMVIFKIRKGGSVMVRFSDLGVNSLFLGGIEAAGVFPAIDPSESSSD